MLGINPKLSKKINRELVLKTIYNNKPISRSDIAKITGLTPASITKIIDEFQDFGLVYEAGSNLSGVGRKPILIDISSEKLFIIGLYIARKSISGIVTNLNAEIKRRIEYSGSFIDQPDLINKVIDLIRELIKNSSISKTKIMGIGMAVPGPINAKKGVIFDTFFKESLPYNWNGIPLAEKVSEIIGLPVFADNCSNVSAIGESWFGNGKKYKNFALISFGEGVGGGLILESRLYRGEDDIVGEIGHTTIDINGSKCDCGNYGCLEMYIKNSTMLNLYKSLKIKHPKCELAKKSVNRLEDIYNFKNMADPIYIDIIDYLAGYLGIAVINLINVLNPEAIIISTNELKDIDLDLIVNKITEMVRQRAYPVVKHKVKIVPSKLKSNIQLVGSIGLVLRDFFELKDAGV